MQGVMMERNWTCDSKFTPLRMPTRNIIAQHSLLASDKMLIKLTEGLRELEPHQGEHHLFSSDRNM